jgi:hypothetical protein
MPLIDDKLTDEQEAAVVELSERGSSELATQFATFIKANAEVLDKLPKHAAKVALVNIAVGPAVMLFDQFGDRSDIDNNATMLEDRFRAMVANMDIQKARPA